MKDRLVEVVDEVVITGQNADEKMCSCESDVVDETCSSESYGACGDVCVAMQSRFLEILDFTQFFDHFVFTPNDENVLEKELKREIPVSVGIELVVVDM